MDMAFHPQTPFAMSPYPSNSLNLLHYHIKGVTSPNGFFNFGGPHSLYAAIYHRPSSRRSLRPEEVLVIPLPLNGTTQRHVSSAIMAFRLDMALHGGGGGSNHQQVVEFCHLVPAEDGDQNYVDDGDPAQNRRGNHILNLDLTLCLPYVTEPVTMTEFVGDIKTKNISKFTDDAALYVVENGHADEAAEYEYIMSSKTDAQIGNLDSIRIWNMLTLPVEIGKALVRELLIEAPIRFDDLRFPSQQELLPVPQRGGRRAAVAADCKANDEALFPIRIEKRKALGAADEDESHRHNLPMKKPHHGGIYDVAKAVAGDKVLNLEAEQGIYSDSDSD